MSPPLSLLSEVDWRPLWLSLRVAGVATLIAWLAGMALGWVVARTRLPGRTLLEAVCMLPLVLKSASAAFAGVDRTLEAAARTLRQSPWSVFVRVTLPLAGPGILAGTLLAFARAMGEFGASLMVAGSIPGRTQTLSMAIYDAVQAGEEHTAAVLVLVTSVLSVAVLVLSNRLFSRP